jgi:hypothetical protein
MGRTAAKELFGCRLFINDDAAKGNSSYLADFFGH